MIKYIFSHAWKHVCFFLLCQIFLLFSLNVICYILPSRTKKYKPNTKLSKIVVIFVILSSDTWISVMGQYSLLGQGYWLGHVGHDSVVRTGTRLLVGTFGAR